ncbi:MAG: hypothetical protein H7346_12730 [Burkholderiaceae bacterium]|nr:hypothetical protein [Burkholderiaceae bacterium]
MSGDRRTSGPTTPATGRPVRTGSPPNIERPLNLFAPATTIPEAVELNGDSAWNQFQDLAARQDAGYAATEPSALAGALKAATPGPAPATLDEVLLEARRLNRVCPKPMQWVRFYALLPDRRPGMPPPPLQGRSWEQTSSLGKRMVLRDQIEWAAARGGLDKAMAHLRSLREEDWLHMDE